MLHQPEHLSLVAISTITIQLQVCANLASSARARLVLAETSLSAVTLLLLSSSNKPFSLTPPLDRHTRALHKLTRQLKTRVPGSRLDRLRFQGTCHTGAVLLRLRSQCNIPLNLNLVDARVRMNIRAQGTSRLACTWKRRRASQSAVEVIKLV